MPIIAQAPAAAVVNNTGITTAQIFPLASSSSAACTLLVPGSNRLNGVRFKVVASGDVTVGGVSPTVNLGLYSGTSLTPGSNSLLTGASAVTVTTSKSYPWFIEVNIIGTNTADGSTQAQGYAVMQIGNTAAPATTALATIAGAAFTFSSEPVANLVLGLTFGVANAANTATMNEFYLYAD